MSFWTEVGRLNDWDLGAAALAYGSAGGLSVFPLWGVVENGGACRCPSGAECTESGKHPLVGWKEGASADAGVIREWWGKWPWANIGVHLGKSGLLVLDLDQRADVGTGEIVDGADSLDVWASETQCAIPQTVVARTGSGGEHRFLLGESKNVNGWLPCVDVKSVGGYVVLAPSLHVSGGHYQWVTGSGASGLAGAPQVLLDALAVAKSASGPSGGSAGAPGGSGGYDYAAAKLDGPPVGARDQFFNAYAFQLRKDGVAESRALALLRAVWEKTAEKETFAWSVVESKVKRLWGAGESGGVAPDEDKAPENVVQLAGWAKGMAAPAGGGGSMAVGQSAGAPPAPEYDPAAAGRWLSETGAAAKFIELNVQWHRYSPGWGWYAWSDREGRWKYDVEDSRVRTIGMARLLEWYTSSAESRAAKASDSDGKAWEKFVSRLESAAGQKAVISLAQGWDEIQVVDLDAWDPDIWEVGFANVVSVNLESGAVYKPQPGHMRTRSFAVAWEGLEVECPQWEAHIRWMTAKKDGTPDEEEYQSMWRFLGYSITGSVEEQKAMLLVGPGRNGKTVMTDVLAAVLGDYAWEIPVKALVGKDDENTFELARLLGVRFAHGPELPERGLNVERFKRLSGESKLSTRRIYKEPVTFRQQAKLILHGNRLPKVPTSASKSDGYWRRLHPLGCEQQVGVGEEDRGLAQRLVADEGPGIAAWLVRGAMAWRKEGLVRTWRSALMMGEYRDDENPLIEFVETMFASEEKGEWSGLEQDRVWVPKVALYAWYAEWSREVGDRPLPEREWAELAKHAGLEPTTPRRYKNNSASDDPLRYGAVGGVKNGRGYKCPPLLDETKKWWGQV